MTFVVVNSVNLSNVVVFEKKIKVKLRLIWNTMK